MIRFSISVQCLCLRTCPFCACLVNVIKHYKCPLQCRLEENPPSSTARCNPPAHIAVVHAQPFRQLAQGNVSLLSSTIPLASLMLFLLTWVLFFQQQVLMGSIAFPSHRRSDDQKQSSVKGSWQLMEMSEVDITDNRETEMTRR